MPKRPKCLQPLLSSLVQCRSSHFAEHPRGNQEHYSSSQHHSRKESRSISLFLGKLAFEDPPCTRAQTNTAASRCLLLWVPSEQGVGAVPRGMQLPWALRGQLPSNTCSILPAPQSRTKTPLLVCLSACFEEKIYMYSRLIPCFSASWLLHIIS